MQHSSAVRPNNTLHPPPNWWRLPFALALAVKGGSRSLCYLCGQQPCLPAATKSLVMGANEHWFNQINYLCAACHHSIHWQTATFKLSAPSQLIEGVASTHYQLPYAQCMREFKNHAQWYQLPVLIHALRQLERPIGCHPQNSMIIAVPSSIKRLQERGFDPVRWLSMYLSFHWQLPLYQGVSREARRHQQGLTREERLGNVTGSFTVSAWPNVQHVVVFDDVVTTGATLDALIAAILSHSPNQNPPIVHARALLHG